MSILGGGFGGPLGGGLGGDGGISGTPGSGVGGPPSVFATRDQASQISVTGYVNAGIPYENVKLFAPGMNLLSIETTALTAAWSTGLVLTTDWSNDGLDWKPSGFATINTTTIVANLAITGVPWIRTRVHATSVGTAGDRVLITLTATRTN